MSDDAAERAYLTPPEPNDHECSCVDAKCCLCEQDAQDDPSDTKWAVRPR